MEPRTIVLYFVGRDLENAIHRLTSLPYVSYSDAIRYRDEQNDGPTDDPERIFMAEVMIESHNVWVRPS